MTNINAANFGQNLSDYLNQAVLYQDIINVSTKNGNVLRNNPFQNPPPYERLQGSFSAYYSRRINRQHRLVYTVDEAERVVKIVSMWTHYEQL